MVAEIHRKLVQTYGEKCIDVLNVRRWKRDFENNGHVLLDEWHSGSPAGSLTVDDIQRVCEIFKADDHFTLNEIIACMPPIRCGVNYTHNQSRCVPIMKTQLSVGTLHLVTPIFDQKTDRLMIDQKKKSKID